MKVKEGKTLPTRRHFGTDGVRGLANADLSPELIFALGRGVIRWLMAQGVARPEVAVGRDSRLSGDLIEAALTAGMLSEGARVRRLGVLPTAGVAFTTRTLGLDAGAMISASHNPIGDNGVKFFSRDGVKLSDGEEAAIEAEMAHPAGERPVGVDVGRLGPDIGNGPYLEFLKGIRFRTYPGRVLVDAAFGSAAAVLPGALDGAAEALEVRNGEVDGARINVRSGSTHLEALTEEIRRRADGTVGLAFDGDADRVLGVDEDGRAVSGDHIVLLLAPWFRSKGWLKVPRVALSVLSNLALSEALGKEGIGVSETPVGDRYLIEAMRSEDLALGAEPSGHVVAWPFNTTGDGLVTARLILAALAETATSLRELVARFIPYPQLQDAVRVPAQDRKAVAEHALVAERVAVWHDAMGEGGRLLVRPSGTEGLVRVMVETADLAFCRRILDDVLDAVRRAREEVTAQRGDPGIR